MNQLLEDKFWDAMLKLNYLMDRISKTSPQQPPTMKKLKPL